MEIDEIERTLLDFGVDIRIRKGDKEYKALSCVIEELCKIWDEKNKNTMNE